MYVKSVEESQALDMHSLNVTIDVIMWLMPASAPECEF